MRKAGLVLPVILGVLFTFEYAGAEQAKSQTMRGVQEVNQPQVPQDGNHVVMTLDGKKLTIRQIRFLSPQLNYSRVEDIASYWLDTQLLYEEAVKRGVDKDEKAKFLADISYKKTIANELIDRVRNEAKVTEQEIQKYYEENKQTDPALMEPMYLSFSHITLNSPEEAQAVLEKIKNGQDINELAKELSAAPDAKKGGKANKYQEKTVESRFGKDFLDALLNASEGQIIGPIKNKDGKYEVARHEGKRSPQIKSFEKVQQTIRATLENQARKKAVEELLNGLKEKAKQRYTKTGILGKKDDQTEKGKNSEQKKN